VFLRYYALYQYELSVTPQPLHVNSHKFVDYITAGSLEKVFAQFQAEAMNDTRRTRILLRFVKHTSMSVGDVVIDDEGHAFMVLPMGFGEVDLATPEVCTELALHLLSLGLETTAGWRELFEHDPAALATAIVARLRNDPYGVGHDALKPFGIPPALEDAA